MCVRADGEVEKQVRYTCIKAVAAVATFPRKNEKTITFFFSLSPRAHTCLIAEK